MMASNRNLSDNKIQNDCGCRLAEHRRAALLALGQAALEMDELREALGETGTRSPRAEHFGLDDLIDHIEARLHDEAKAMGVFADEYECGCEAKNDERRTDVPAGFEDEDVTTTPERMPDRRRTAPQRPPRVAALVFGALGVACSFASYVLRSNTSALEE